MPIQTTTLRPARRPASGTVGGTSACRPRSPRLAEPTSGDESSSAAPPRSSAAPRESRRPPTRTPPPRRRAARSRQRRRARRPRAGGHAQVGDGVERAPQQRAPDRAEVRPPAGFRLALQERLVEALRAGDVAVVEVAGIRSRTRHRDRTRSTAGTRSTRSRPTSRSAWSRRAARPRTPPPGRGARAGTRRSSACADEAPRHRSAMNLISWSRLNPAWLTIGATMLRRTR